RRPLRSFVPPTDPVSSPPRPPASSRAASCCGILSTLTPHHTPLDPSHPEPVQDRLLVHAAHIGKRPNTPAGVQVAQRQRLEALSPRHFCQHHLGRALTHTVHAAVILAIL